MKKIWLFTLFVLYLAACSGNSNSSDDQDESSSSHDNSTYCRDEYGFTKDNGWTKDISDSSYITDYVCDQISQHMSIMFSFYARCTSASYNKSINRIDMDIITEGGYKHIWAEVYGCKYKIGSDGDFGAWVAKLSEWSLDDCLCNEEDDVTHYRKKSTVSEEESSSSDSPINGSSSSFTQPPHSSSGGKLVCYESETESACIYVYDSSSSNGSIKPSSSTSEVNTNPYTYIYHGVGDLHLKELTTNITSDCVNAECFEDFENFDFKNSTANTETLGPNGSTAGGKNEDTGIALTSSQYVVFPWRLDKKIAEGSLDLYFKPSAGFYKNWKTSALAGNDGARMSMFIYGGSLYFYKNLPDNPISLSVSIEEAKLTQEWNRITAEWSDTKRTIALFVNEELVAKKSVPYGHYEPSSRGDADNVFVLGYKSSCCMGLISEEMFANGYFDNVQVVTYNIFDITE